MNTSNRISDILGELCGNPQTAEQDEQLHQAEQAIQQELLKARIETLEWLLEQEVEFGGLELKQSIIDKVADLQKELKENSDGSTN